MPIFIVSSILLVVACDPDETPKTRIDLRDISYDPVDVTLPAPDGFPIATLSADNPLTADGIELGRRLFYDPILSADSTQSCSSCHLQEFAFSDPRQFSIGVDGIAGRRNSMALINLAFNSNGFLWDGRSATLEAQAAEPVQDPVELHENWPNVEVKLQRNAMYQEYFRKAFGIEFSDEITKDLATKALAQFVSTLVSYRSTFDKSRGFVPVQGIRPVLTEAEERGRSLFFESNDSIGEDPQCGHCHNTELFTNNSYRNNGLDAANGFDDFPDLGFGGVTGFNNDKGKFRTPTVRNIELTAPYMHDGRFNTLEEVLDHYNEHVQSSPTLDANLAVPFNNYGGLLLSEKDKADIIAFLKTLTDMDFIKDPAFSNPFE